MHAKITTVPMCAVNNRSISSNYSNFVFDNLENALFTTAMFVKHGLYNVLTCPPDHAMVFPIRHNEFPAKPTGFTPNSQLACLREATTGCSILRWQQPGLGWESE